MQVDLGFIRPTAVRPNVDLTKLVLGNPLDLERRSIAIEGLSVDSHDPAAMLAQRGFAAIPFEGKFDVESKDPKWRDEFARVVTRTIAALIGAPHAVVMPSPGRVRRGVGAGADTALFQCHGDFTPSSAAAKFSVLQQSFPKARKARRFAAYNAWWLASEPPQDVPLALCDATTVAASDMMPGSAVVHDATGAASNFGEIAFYRYNPRHRWFWYPELTSAHLLVFAGHDSNPDFASQVPHCAFINSACPPTVSTRVSVECRCFAYW